MQETNPCNAIAMTTTTTTTTTTSTISEISDSVLQKNLHNNSSPRYSDDQSSSTSADDTELAREKFFRSLVNDSLNFGGESSSSLLQPNNCIFSQIDSQLELPSSARARNELLAFDDTTESELATLCDNTYSEDREDVLSITYEESSEEFNESSVKNTKDCKEDNSFDKANSEDTTSTTKEATVANESLIFDNPEDSDSQATKFEANIEIDGKYLKSLVNSKKNPKKIDDDESSTRPTNEMKKEEKPVLSVDESTSKISGTTTSAEDESKKDVKHFEDDLSYIKRLRLIINNKPTTEYNKNQRQQLQGSLDSINLKESNVSAKTTIFESMAKKSKSFDSIKGNVPVSSKPSKIITSDDSASKVKTDDSASQLVTAPEFDAQTNDVCNACCFTNNEQPSSNDVFCSQRSNSSSPRDEDSTECDICSSCNLHDSNEAIDCKDAEKTNTLTENTEICEICGEPATSTDDLFTDSSKPPVGVVSRPPPMPYNLPKAKSTLEISRGSYRMSTLEDDRFEIENCGLQECKLRASLDTCNKPEPLYVNIVPRHHRQLFSDVESQKSSKQNYHANFSESDNRSQGSRFYEDSRSIGLRDETTMSRSLSIGGNKRLARKGSYAKKNVTDRTQEKRRFSSVDNLQNRMSFKSNGEKFSKSRDNKFMTSADSIRPQRMSRSRSLRRSADNVGRFDSSGDNLDSLEENADTDGNGAASTSNSKSKIRDSETIKMILTKHGIKIISQKETVL